MLRGSAHGDPAFVGLAGAVEFSGGIPADMQRAVTALLGPTNTGKTHLALERMLTHASGMIGFPLRLLARENYDRVVALRGPSSGRARHGRGAHRPEAAGLLDVHGRGDAARPAHGLPGGRRGPARRRPRARPRLHRADPERARAARDVADRRRDDRGRCSRSCCRTPRSPRRPRLSTLRYAEPKRSASCPPRSARDRVLGARALRGGRAPAPRAGRRRARVRRALRPRTRNAQVALYQAGRGGPPGRDRRDRDGPEPRHRPRRLHGPRQVRRRRAARAHGRRGRPDRGTRRPPRARRPASGRAPSSAPFERRARRGRRDAPLRPAQPPLLADRRARLLLAARAARQPRAPAAAAPSCCACATPRTSARSRRSRATRRPRRSRATRSRCGCCGRCARCPTSRAC